MEDIQEYRFVFVFCSCCSRDLVLSQMLVSGMKITKSITMKYAVNCLVIMELHYRRGKATPVLLS